jgi:hypothetical protein
MKKVLVYGIVSNPIGVKYTTRRCHSFSEAKETIRYFKSICEYAKKGIYNKFLGYEYTINNYTTWRLR